jgi:hypothetical protein
LLVQVGAAVWAVHFGYTNFGDLSFDLIVDALNDQHAELIGLVETDLSRPIMANRDLGPPTHTHTHTHTHYLFAPAIVPYFCTPYLYTFAAEHMYTSNTFYLMLSVSVSSSPISKNTSISLPTSHICGADGSLAVQYVAEKMHMYSEFGPSTRENTWGCALLSTYPIVQRNRVILPSPEGELACMVDAVVDINGTRVRVLVPHFGNTEDKLDLKLQHEAVRDLVGNITEPIIFIGYITGRPYSPNYKVPMLAKVGTFSSISLFLSLSLS